MHMPSNGSSADTLLKVYGVYHLTRLQADKKVKELADGFAKSQERLQEKADAFEAASVAAMRTMAIRDGEDRVKFELRMQTKPEALFSRRGAETQRNPETNLFLAE